MYKWPTAMLGLCKCFKNQFLVIFKHRTHADAVSLDRDRDTQAVIDPSLQLESLVSGHVCTYSIFSDAAPRVSLLIKSSGNMSSCSV